MALRARVEPIDRDIALALEETAGKARAAALADYATQAIAEATETNRRVLGHVPPSTTTVDGRLGAPLGSVKPDGIIVEEFDLVGEVLRWIADQLETHSPVKSGRYKKSHALFADGVETSADSETFPQAREYVFVNLVPYARKLERGSSSQAPDGVYQAVAILAARRFGNIARVSYGFRAVEGLEIGHAKKTHQTDNRNPAVIVTVAS